MKEESLKQTTSGGGGVNCGARHGLFGFPAWVTFCVSLAVYSYTCFRGVAGGDSGEFLAEACAGGIVAHPPGYPLLIKLLRAQWKLFQWVLSTFDFSDQSAPTFAFAANLLNGMLASFANGFLTQAVDLLTNHQFQIEAVCAGLWFGLSSLVWEHSIGAEVFALNNLLVGLLHVLLIRHIMQPSVSNATLGAFVCGLGLTNQHTIVLLEAPVVVFVLYTGRHVFRIRDLFQFAVAFLVPFVGLYALAYVHAASMPPTKGSWGDLSTLGGLQRHLLRREYGTFRLSTVSSKSESFVERIWWYLNQCSEEFRLLGVLLAFLGILWGACFAGNDDALRVCVRFQLFGWMFYHAVFQSLANIPLENPLAQSVSSRFSLQPNTFVAIWIGLGIAGLSKLGEFTPDAANRSGFRCKIHHFFLGCLVYTHSHRNALVLNHHQDGDVLSSYGKSILNGLPRNSLLFSYTDINWNTVRYLQTKVVLCVDESKECEHVRPDVTHLSLQLIPYPWYKRQHDLYDNLVHFPDWDQSFVSTDKMHPAYIRYLVRVLQYNLASKARRVFIDLHGIDHSHLQQGIVFADQIALRPFGLVWEVFRINRAPSYRDWRTQKQAQAERVLSTFSLDHATHYPATSWEFVARKVFHDGLDYQQSLCEMEYLREFIQRIDDKSGATKWELSVRKSLSDLHQLTNRLHSLVVQLNVSLPASATSTIHTPLPALTYPVQDVVKNSALAHLYFVKAISFHREQAFELLHVKSFEQLKPHFEQAVDQLEMFLALPTSPKDADFATYTRFHANLVQLTNQFPSIHSGGKRKSTKKHKNKTHNRKAKSKRMEEQ